MSVERQSGSMTRRNLTAAALALPALAGAGAAPAGPKAHRPLVIAHRGASGERPEETQAAYELAIDEGCDFIEPDLVVTKDGHLVARHENEIGGTTDVASRPEFAARKATKTVDGVAITGWFVEDFTLEELKTIRARERLPQLRPGSAGFDGKYPILTFAEVCAIARAGTKRTGRTIGVYPEMKHPTYLAGIGLPIEDRLLSALKTEGLNSRSAAVFVQCFEVGSLKWMRAHSTVKTIQLVDGETGPADMPSVKYAEMVSPTGLKAMSAYADGLGPDKAMVVSEVAGKLVASSLVADAHGAGMKVHPWTVRAENMFLPRSLQVGTSLEAHGHVEALFAALYAAGVDGLFSDFPRLAVEARARLNA